MMNNKKIVIGVSFGIVVILIVGLFIYFEKPLSQSSIKIENQMVTTSSVQITEEMNKFSWLIEDGGSDPDLDPRTRVTLKNSETAKIYFSKIYTGNCSEFKFEDPSLEKNELTEVDCWWAGSGDNIGAFYENGKYILKEGVTDEGDLETPGVDEWKTATEINI